MEERIPDWEKDSRSRKEFQMILNLICLTPMNLECVLTLNEWMNGWSAHVKGMMMNCSLTITIKEEVDQVKKRVMIISLSFWTRWITTGGWRESLRAWVEKERFNDWECFCNLTMKELGCCCCWSESRKQDVSSHENNRIHKSEVYNNNYFLMRKNPANK